MIKLSEEEKLNLTNEIIDLYEKYNENDKFKLGYAYRLKVLHSEIIRKYDLPSNISDTVDLTSLDSTISSIMNNFEGCNDWYNTIYIPVILLNVNIQNLKSELISQLDSDLYLNDIESLWCNALVHLLKDIYNLESNEELYQTLQIVEKITNNKGDKSRYYNALISLIGYIRGVENDTYEEEVSNNDKIK